MAWIEIDTASTHRCRLVINIKGAKIWVTNTGGQTFWDNIFSDNILNKFEKIPFYSLKFLKTFLVINNFKKNYTLHSKCTPFSLYLSFFVSVSALFHVLFFLNKKITNSRLIIGGAKKVFCPPS